MVRDLAVLLPVERQGVGGVGGTALVDDVRVAAEGQPVVLEQFLLVDEHFSGGGVLPDLHAVPGAPDLNLSD